MSYSKTEQICFDLVKPIAEENDCFIYDVEYVKEGSTYFLRVFADKDGGISIDECEKISRSLSTELDKKDPIKENYFLEVSSPGIERRLRQDEHFKRYINEKVDISFYKQTDGAKQITAILKEYDGTLITVEYNEKILKYNLNEISVVKLHFDF